MFYPFGPTCVYVMMRAKSNPELKNPGLNMGATARILPIMWANDAFSLEQGRGNRVTLLKKWQWENQSPCFDDFPSSMLLEV